MDILTAYSGLAIAFIIIVAILLYFLIATKLKLVIKIALIPLVIWYSLVLFYTPGKMMGWPTYENIPPKSRLIYYMVKEPMGTEEGCIYFWVIAYKDHKTRIIDQLNPKNIFSYSEDSAPRAFRIPYTRENHKKINKAVKELMKKRGGVILLEGGGHKSIWDPKELKFKVLNPEVILTKEGTEIHNDPDEGITERTR